MRKPTAQIIEGWTSTLRVDYPEDNRPPQVKIIQRSPGELHTFHTEEDALRWCRRHGKRVKYLGRR